MNRIAEIRDLFAYNRWANLRVLDAAEKLSDEDLRRDLGSSFPSVLDTLVHIVQADWIWVRRWAGESPGWPPPGWNLTDVAAVRRQWEAVEAERTAVLDELDEEGLGREVAYGNTRGIPFTNRMDEMLRHVVNHSSYHRGQVTTMLRQLGAATVNTDLIAYYRERGQ